MVHIAYCEAPKVLVPQPGGGYLWDRAIPGDINGDHLFAYEVRGGPVEVGRYKVWTKSESFTKADLGATWFSTDLPTAAARWGEKVSVIGLGGTIVSVDKEEDRTRIGQFKFREAKDGDGAFAYADNPDAENPLVKAGL